MADNYLEKKMEDYRSGALQRRRGATSASSRLRHGQAIISYPPIAVMIEAEEAGEVVEAVAARLKGLGCSVDLWVADGAREAQNLAYRCGITFHPGLLEDARSHAAVSRGGISATVEINADAIKIMPVGHRIVLAGLAPADAAANAAWALTPAAASLMPLTLAARQEEG